MDTTTFDFDPSRCELPALDPSLERKIDEMIAARRDRGIRPDSARKIAMFGGSFFPPHFGHEDAVFELEAQGYEVWVEVSMGHIYKLHTAGSYAMRDAMARLTFGRRVHGIEAEIWPRIGLPIYTWDILTEIRARVGDSVQIVAAIGPDIDPKTWQGYPEIMRDGFDFVRIKDRPGRKRSTDIRNMIAAGAPRSEWSKYVPEPVADFISRYSLFSGRVPERPDLTYVT